MSSKEEMRTLVVRKKCGDDIELYSQTSWNELSEEDVECKIGEYPKPPCDPILIIHGDRPDKADCYIRNNLVMGMANGPIVYKCTKQEPEAKDIKIKIDYPYYKLPLTGEYIDYKSLELLNNVNHWVYRLDNTIGPMKIGTAGFYLVSRIHCDRYEKIYTLTPLNDKEIKMYLSSEPSQLPKLKEPRREEFPTNIERQVFRVLQSVREDPDEQKRGGYTITLERFYEDYPNIVLRFLVKQLSKAREPSFEYTYIRNMVEDRTIPDLEPETSYVIEKLAETTTFLELKELLKRLLGKELATKEYIDHTLRQIYNLIQAGIANKFNPNLPDYLRQRELKRELGKIDNIPVGKSTSLVKRYLQKYGMPPKRLNRAVKAWREWKKAGGKLQDVFRDKYKEYERLLNVP